jgi:tripartite-type tricarboxylate transporter receptor subunit TctC
MKILVLCLSLICPSVWAENIKVIVGFTAGGGTDYVTRTLTSDAEKNSNLTFLVENKPGANGTVALRSYFEKFSDNTILGVSGGQILFEPLTNPENNFLYRLKIIGPVLESPLSVAALPSTKIQSLNDLFNRDVPKQKINVGTAGESHNILLSLISKYSHHDIVGIPFKGTGDAHIALLGGHIDLQIAEYAFFKQRSSTISVIAVANSRGIDNVPSLTKHVPEGILTNFFAIAVSTDTKNVTIIDQSLQNGFIKLSRRDYFENQGYAIDSNIKSDYISRKVLPSFFNWKKLMSK